MKRPNLFIVGAPKCGTTTLSSWLKKHPEIYFSPIKEPHFFYSPYGKPELTKDEYENLFSAASKKHKIIAEASVWYLFSEIAPARILKYNPDALFIVCLRNPSEMAPSLHSQKLYTGHEKEKDFSRAWNLSSKREQGLNVKTYGIPDGDPAHLSYRAACKLGSQVESLLTQIASDRILFVTLSDLVLEPEKTWRSVLHHLKVKEIPLPHKDNKNPATKRRNTLLHRTLMLLSRLKKKLGIKKKSGLLAPIHRLNTTVEKYPEPNAKTKNEMSNYFKEEIQKIESLTGIRL